MKLTETNNEIIIENSQLFTLVLCVVGVIGGVVVAVQSMLGEVSWIQLAVGVAIAMGSVVGAFFVKNRRFVLRREGESEVISKSVMLRKETQWSFQATDVAGVLRSRHSEASRMGGDKEKREYKTAVALKLKDGREVTVYKNESSGDDKTISEAERVRRLADTLAQFYNVSVEADEEGAAAVMNGLKDLVSVFKGDGPNSASQSSPRALIDSSEQTLDPTQVAAATPGVEMVPTPVQAAPTAPENEAVAPMPAFAANPLAAAAVSDSMQPAAATSAPVVTPQSTSPVEVAPTQLATAKDEYNMSTSAPLPTAPPMVAPTLAPIATLRPAQAPHDRPISSLGRTASPLAASRPIAPERSMPTLPPRQ